jgi:hypothetical protein
MVTLASPPFLVVPGPYDGWWIKDGDKVLLWAYSHELARRRLKEMS